MYRSLVIVFVLSLTAHTTLPQSRFSGTPSITNYGTEDFRGGIQNWCMVQDKRGILYVANNFGMLEFDGSTWNIYPVKNGTKVRSLYIGQDENIYVGSQADFGYFSPDHRGTLQYHSLADSLPPEHRNFDEVWRIFELKDRVYFMTFKNIFEYIPGKPVRIIEPRDPLEFSFFVNNEIYSLVWNEGLSVLSNDSLHLLEGGEFFAHLQIASILPYDKSRLLVFSIRDGLYLYDGHHVKPFTLGDSSALKGMIINQAITLQDGTFAIATQNNGLILISREGELLLHLNRTNGLTDQTIHTVYEDVHQNLWLGLNNGLSMIELSSPFSLIDGTMGLAGTGYAALQNGKELYLGTNNGLFYLREDQPQRSFTLVPNSTGQVYQLTQIGNNILMGHHNGAYLIRDNNAQLLFSEKGVWDFLPVPDLPDHLVMGSYTGLSLVRYSGKDLEYVRKYAGFEESSRVLDFDNENNLWMAHGYKGIYKLRFDPGYEKIASVKFYNSHNGLPADHLNNMERINNEMIFPALFGIFRYDKSADTFVMDKKFSSLFHPDEHIVKMEQDMLGNIYFISNQRVGRLSFDKFGNASMETKLFNKIRDQLNDDLGTIAIIDSKNVLFGAKKGFIHYNADKRKEMQKFHTQLTKVFNISGETDSLMVEGKKITRVASIELPYRFNSLRFTYSSSFFEDPDKTQYQYYLENFDKGWSDWTLKTEKEYTNLPEGNYHFHVRAKNVYDTISEAESFSFSVAPPFYRSRLAYFLYSLSGILLLTLSFYQLDKRFKKEKRMIMLKQERELNKKNTEIKQITDQSEQAIVKLRNEKLQSEVDHMNRELTSSTIHLINKNELLNNVKSGLEDILKKNGVNGHSDEMKRIIKNIDTNINSDGDWKQFELHFNNVHENFTDRLLEKYPRLTPQEIKLSAYLRLNLTTKEIANLLNISVRGVEISRYRLRKKLMLDRNENLTDFMLKF